MKRLLVLLVLLSIFVFGLSAQSVTVDFKIVGHKVDFMKLQESVQSEINNGYTPLGITGYNDKLYFLYLSENVMPMTAWQLSRYDSLEEMDESIAGKITNGWFPAGYSELNGDFFILFLESPYKASYYMVKDSEIDSEKLGLQFEPFLRTGTIPMDLDILGDIQLYLSAQMANMPAADWKQESFDFESENLQSEIAAEMVGRYLPWGLDITEGVLRINFIKFK
ncbi:MAG TPA: hypothetical protein DCO79_11150 [Spirochaeta sp.]|nr:hypothetical protein [Spirochaeta sp.]